MKNITRTLTCLLLTFFSLNLLAQSFPDCTGTPPTVVTTDKYSELLPCSDDNTLDFASGYYIDGDHAFLSSPNFGTGGVVYHYKHDGVQWQAESTISASDAAASASFGSRIAVDGNRMAIAAPKDGPDGAIYLFEYDGSAWNEKLKISAPTVSGINDFGNIFDIDGDSTLAVVFNKSLHVYELNSDVIVKNYVRNNGTRGYNNQVSVEGQWLIAVGHSLKVLRHDGNNYKAFQRIPRPSKGHLDLFVDLEINGNRIVCGQPEDDNRDYGRAFISQFDGTSWTYPTILKHFKDECADGQLLGSKFGRRVSIDDERVLIYSDQDKYKTNSPGILNIYSFDATGYRFRSKYVFPEFEANMHFGQSHEMDAGRMIAVAPSSSQPQKRAIIVDFNAVCLTPINATATAVPGGMSFSWDAEPLATNYNLMLHPCDGGSAFLKQPVMGTSVTIPSPPAGTPGVTWHLQSVCGIGDKSVRLRKGFFNWPLPREMADAAQASISNNIAPNPTNSLTYLNCIDCEVYPQVMGTDGRMHAIELVELANKWELDLSAVVDGLYIIMYRQGEAVKYEQVLISK